MGNVIATSTMSDEAGSNSDDSGSGAVGLPEFKCSWCQKGCRELVEGRKYCLKCKNRMYKECRTCKRPLDSPSFFKLDSERCNSCTRKLEKSRLSRRQKQVSKTDSIGKTKVPELVGLEKLPVGEWYAVLPIVNLQNLKQKSESNE